MKQQMTKEFGEETMKLMEKDVLHHHRLGVRFFHPPPSEETTPDAYWAHILIDWCGVNEKQDFHEIDSLHNPEFWDRAYRFLLKNINLLTNKSADTFFIHRIAFPPPEYIEKEVEP